MLCNRVYSFESFERSSYTSSWMSTAQRIDFESAGLLLFFLDSIRALHGKDPHNVCATCLLRWREKTRLSRRKKSDETSRQPLHAPRVSSE